MNKSLKDFILTALAALALVSCEREKVALVEPGAVDGKGFIEVSVSPSMMEISKSSIYSASDESAVRTYKVFAYEKESGIMPSDNGVYVTYYNGSTPAAPLKLRANTQYDIYALVNMGDVALSAMADRDTADDFTFSISSVNDLKTNGIPAATKIAWAQTSSSTAIELNAERLVAKYNVSLKRNFVDPQSVFTINSIRLKQAAKSVKPFASDSKAASASDVIDGDYGSSSDLAVLNVSGNSQKIVFYTLENCQGVPTELASNTDPWGKVPDNSSPIADKATYIEMTGTYTTPGFQGSPVFRMYLGADNVKDFNIVRNKNYNLDISVSDASLSYGNDYIDIGSWKLEEEFDDERELGWDDDMIDILRYGGAGGAGYHVYPSNLSYDVVIHGNIKIPFDTPYHDKISAATYLVNTTAGVLTVTPDNAGGIFDGEVALRIPSDQWDYHYIGLPIHIGSQYSYRLIDQTSGTNGIAGSKFGLAVMVGDKGASLQDNVIWYFGPANGSLDNDGNAEIIVVNGSGEYYAKESVRTRAERTQYSAAEGTVTMADVSFTRLSSSVVEGDIVSRAYELNLDPRFTGVADIIVRDKTTHEIYATFVTRFIPEPKVWWVGENSYYTYFHPDSFSGIMIRDLLSYNQLGDAARNYVEYQTNAWALVDYYNIQDDGALQSDILRPMFKFAVNGEDEDVCEIDGVNYKLFDTCSIFSYASGGEGVQKTYFKFNESLPAPNSISKEFGLGWKSIFGRPVPLYISFFEGGSSTEDSIFASTLLFADMGERDYPFDKYFTEDGRIDEFGFDHISELTAAEDVQIWGSAMPVHYNYFNGDGLYGTLGYERREIVVGRHLIGGSNHLIFNIQLPSDVNPYDAQNFSVSFINDAEIDAYWGGEHILTVSLPFDADKRLHGEIIITNKNTNKIFYIHIEEEH